METTVPARRVEPLANPSSYAAYEALMAHMRVCHGCAHATRPCTTGTGLRRTWKAARAA